MPVRLAKPGGGTDGVILEPKDLKDGQICAVFSWSLTGGGYDGLVMQKRGNQLVSMGEDSFSTLPLDTKCRVRILPNGTTLTIEDNE